MLPTLADRVAKTALPLRQQRQEMLHQQRRADGVHREIMGQMRRVEIAPALLRLEAMAMQEAAGVEQQPQFAGKRRDMAGRLFDAGLVEQIERRIAVPAKAQHQGKAAALAQLVQHGGTNAAASADHHGDSVLGKLLGHDMPVFCGRGTALYT